MGRELRIKAARWTDGLLSPVPKGHTVQSALATSLALLRLCAAEIEEQGGSAGGIRQHIAEVEHLA
jgi:hypothetical protein